MVLSILLSVGHCKERTEPAQIPQHQGDTRKEASIWWVGWCPGYSQLDESGRVNAQGPMKMTFIYFIITIFCLFLPFLGPLPWHMEVPRLGV